MRRFFVTLAASLAAFILATGAPVYATESAAPSASASTEPSASASAAPPSAPAAAPECAAYTYFGTKTSLCADFGGRTEVDCAAIGYRVALKNKAVDPWRLDQDGNGVGCQSCGRKPTPSATPSATPSTETPAAGGQGPTLPLTGPGTGALVLGGMGVVGVLAGVTVYAVGRRRQRFQA